MELSVKDYDRHYTIELKVNKTTWEVRGLVLLMSTLEKSDLRPEARSAFNKIKELWEENFSPPK